MKRIQYLLALLVVLFQACGESPKVIHADTTSSEVKFNPQVPIDVSPKKSFTDDLHQVVIQEKKEADKYLYVRVEENKRRYWMAVPNQDIQLGETYYYRNGLLKTGFKSKVYNMVFDTIYLVSTMVPAKHGQNANSRMNAANNTQKLTGVEVVASEKSILFENPITIAELLNNKDKYAGNRVRIKGVCTKINPQIMKRNWIHLQDGSFDDFDLVITSNSFVSVGKEITIEANVSLNRDFGAGYSFELILEEGIIVAQ